MTRFLRRLLPIVLAAGCSGPPQPTTPSPSASPNATPATPAPGDATPPPTVPAVDPKAKGDKLKEELFDLAVDVGGFGEITIYADALTEGGEFKPGIAERLARLDGARSVKALDLPAFGPGAGKAIAAVPGLTRVILWRTKAASEAIAHLGGCPTLEYLELNNGSGEFPVVDDTALAGLKGLTKLKKLECTNGHVTGEGLAPVAGMTDLDTLVLAGCPIDDAAGPHLAGLTALTTLDLSGSLVTPDGLAPVKKLPKLTSLKLDATGLTDDDTTFLAEMTGLKELSLAQTKVTDAGLPPLAGMPALKVLNLGFTPVGDAGMKALAESTSLAELGITDTKVTDDGVIALAGLPELRELRVFRLPLTDKSLTALGRAANLKDLWLGGNEFTADGIAKFKAARPTVRVYE